MNYSQRPRQKSILETYIERACDSTRYEPDLALNLEICDVIKEKQKNTPREAAIYIARLANHKNMHVGMLALSLLDNCVKNCGYPFHLQIATKEFLNSLVRKFPERPLMVPTPIQTRVLEMIQEWYTTLCRTSRYKEDLVHIKDMHRLLSFKGYRFPQAKKTAAAVLNPVESLKSPAELEEEDRVAQAAKLQELIRRGRPEDVRAANELVKRMTGYEQEDKPDYAEQASAELDKIFQKATLLIEMLNDVKPGEIIGRGDIFEDVFGTCKAAHPKVQKFLSENEDPDNKDKLLQLNETLSNVIEQYRQVKNGNLVKVALPEATGDGGFDNARNPAHDTTPVQKQSSFIDLLDFNSSQDESPSSPTSPKTTVSVGSSSSASSTRILPPKPVAQPSISALDDFEFASNIGTHAQDVGTVSVLLMNKNGLQIDFDIEKQSNSPDHALVYKIKAYFSNHQNSPLSALTFRVAVPKTLQLKLNPQSAQVVSPFTKKNVTQEMTIWVPNEIATAVPVAVKMRYHVSYVLAGRTIEEQGEFSQFP
ncbi:hypothetical protein BGZ58_002475 [Dissophora ornata]|nr:hypothetical protein BGZ58_002475 [Dissophora ornata]